MEFSVLEITGQPIFDYCFTLMILFGGISWTIGAALSVITRS